MKAWILINNGSVWDVVFNGAKAKELIEDFFGKIPKGIDIEKFKPYRCVTFSINKEIITVTCMNITGE